MLYVPEEFTGKPSGNHRAAPGSIRCALVDGDAVLLNDNLSESSQQGVTQRPYLDKIRGKTYRLASILASISVIRNEQVPKGTTGRFTPKKKMSLARIIRGI